MKKPKKRTLTVSEKQIAYGMFGGLLIGIFTNNIGLAFIGACFWGRLLLYKKRQKIASSDIVKYLCSINHRHATISNTKY